MSVHLQRRLISRNEYRRMAEAGILAEDERVELLGGELICMSPIGSKHAACLMKCLSLLGRLLPESAILSPQNPISLGEFSEPEPDIALLRHRDDFYAAQLPGAEDVLLLIEIADTSLAKDREVKLPLYAQAGIPELWIVNLPRQVLEVYRQPEGKVMSTSIKSQALKKALEVYRQPEGKNYREQRILQPHEAIQPLRLPGLRVELAQMLPG